MSVPNKAGKRCTDCNGAGAIYLYAEGFNGDHPVQAEYTCAECDGRGWLMESLTLRPGMSDVEIEQRVAAIAGLFGTKAS